MTRFINQIGYMLINYIPSPKKETIQYYDNPEFIQLTSKQVFYIAIGLRKLVCKALVREYNPNEFRQ